MTVKSDLQKLVKTEQADPSFPVAQVIGPRSSQTSVGRKASTDGGTASDLVEASYASREWWPAVTVTTSDGVFTIEETPIKSVLLTSGARIRFAQPT